MKRIVLAALVVLAQGLVGFLGLTSFAPGSAVATWAPCPRNWGWLPAWMPRRSPLRETHSAIDGGHVKVCYGSPSLRGRTMIGGAAVPFGRLWRTGANEPTTLHTNVSITLGGQSLAPGSYAIYTVPGRVEWRVIVNRSTGQWGLESEYTPKVAGQELGRFAVRAETLTAPVEQLAMRFEAAADGAGSDLVLEWQTTRLRLPLAAPPE